MTTEAGLLPEIAGPAAGRPSTKVVATIGPASIDPPVLEKLLRTGVDVVRVNCSHGSVAQHLDAIRAVRQAAVTVGRHVAVLADLQGPKLRVGDLPAPVQLDNGTLVLLRAGVRTCDDGAIPVVYPAFAADLKPGDRVLLHDGLIDTTVVSVQGDDVTVQVITGGILKSRQGVNMPGAAVSAATPTVQDLEHLEQLAVADVDYVALSFVSTADDIRSLRAALTRLGSDAHIVAKLERAESLDNLEEILDVVDVVMVARGDLGVEIGPERVPVAQKRVIARANARGVPVITATEMLESMISSPRPTRAEASDVANAVFDGTDAVMLSAETAAGSYPVEAVAYMQSLCAQATEAPELHRPLPPAATGTISEAVTRAVRDMVAATGATAVVCLTETGASARTVSASRPGVPVLALSGSEKTLRRCAMYHGVTGDLVPPMLDPTAMTAHADELVRSHGLAVDGDIVLVVSGIPGVVGGTNRVYVHTVGSSLVPSAHADPRSRRSSSDRRREARPTCCGAGFVVVSVERRWGQAKRASRCSPAVNSARSSLSSSSSMSSCRYVTFARASPSCPVAGRLRRTQAARDRSSMETSTHARSAMSSMSSPLALSMPRRWASRPS
ncbi:pyruvate kinase [Paenarthrobacter sp. C1]|uniref:pyruvate kinase n=1 Tax=Paenarthrobacter sp. C1 TaxID=3400220 RepID=UPI003BF5EEFB